MLEENKIRERSTVSSLCNAVIQCSPKSLFRNGTAVSKRRNLHTKEGKGSTTYICLDRNNSESATLATRSTNLPTGFIRRYRPSSISFREEKRASDLPLGSICFYRLCIFLTNAGVYAMDSGEVSRVANYSLTFPGERRRHTEV